MPPLSVIFISLLLSNTITQAATVTIKVGYPQLNGGQIPLWVIPESKLDQQYGIDVKPVFIPGGVRLTQAAVSSSVDIALTGGAAINAMLSGADLKSNILGMVEQREFSVADSRPTMCVQSRDNPGWRISAGVVKFFMDGVVESHTAAMLTPYSDDPKQIGALFWDPAKYTQAVTELDKRGIQIFTHAIGDKGVRTALNAYENAARLGYVGGLA